MGNSGCGKARATTPGRRATAFRCACQKGSPRCWIPTASRARLQAAHRHAVDHALSSLPFQRDHRVLFVASDRLEDDWTHHWLFAIACAPNGKWERLALSLRLAASEDAYTHAMGAFMEALLETKRLERFFRLAPVGRPRQRL